MTEINREWRDWIALNVLRGCDGGEIAGILVSNGLDPDEAERLVDEAVIDRSTGNRLLEQDTGSPSCQLLHVPSAIKIENTKAEVFGVANFLNDEECYRLIKLMRSNLKPSTVTGGGGEGGHRSSCRTSKTCDLGAVAEWRAGSKRLQGDTDEMVQKRG